MFQSSASAVSILVIAVIFSNLLNVETRVYPRDVKTNSVSYTASDPTNGTLNDNTGHSIYYGVAVESKYLSDQKYTDILKKHFSSLTPANGT